MRVFVTGASGHIGPAVVPELLTAGHQPTPSGRQGLGQPIASNSPGMDPEDTTEQIPSILLQERFKMKLSGKVTSDLPLLVLALAEEAQSLGTRLPVLLTGMGKVNAACTLAAILGRGPLPAKVVNLGTAGALRPGLNGIQPVNTVIQHDLDADVLRALTGISVGGPITVAASGEGLTLATGDAFIDSAADRNRLADRAHLVDMEGYALAAASSEAGVPIQIVKYVSDDTDESAEGSWRDNVAKAARSLADWAAQNLIDYGGTQ